MPPWDRVGPVRAAARGPLRIFEAGEAREARTLPISDAGGVRRTRDHPTPDPEDRATGKQPCLEVVARSTTMAETSPAVVVHGGSGERRLRRADGSLVRDPLAHDTVIPTSSRRWRGGHLAQA